MTDVKAKTFRMMCLLTRHSLPFARKFINAPPVSGNGGLDEAYNLALADGKIISVCFNFIGPLRGGRLHLVGKLAEGYLLGGCRGVVNDGYILT